MGWVDKEADLFTEMMNMRKHRFYDFYMISYRKTPLTKCEALYERYASYKEAEIETLRRLENEFDLQDGGE